MRSLWRFLLLGFLVHLQPLIAFLDSETLAFQIDDMRFSAYLLLKVVAAILVLFWLASIFSEFGERKIKNLQQMKLGRRALLAKVF